MKRRFIAVLTMICMLGSLLPVAAQAEPEETYSITSSAAITENGLTATISFDPASDIQSGEEVRASISLNGTAVAKGKHTLSVTSENWEIGAEPEPIDVEAGEEVSKTIEFTFQMPATNIVVNSSNNDFILLHEFEEYSVQGNLVTDFFIEDAIGPINGEAPVTAFDSSEQYVGQIEWAGNPDIFEPSRVYEATITLTPRSDYVFGDIVADTFSIPSAKTVSCAPTEDGGVKIDATFMTPPSDYVTDGHGYAAYKIGNHGRFDIRNHNKGNWQGTTFGNEGYGVLYQNGESEPIALSDISQPVDTGDGVVITVEPVFSTDGRFIRLAFTLENTNDTPATVSIGSWADIEIAGDDNAPITKFPDGRGFKMVNQHNQQQFNFFGKGTLGVNDVDTFWFGHYGSAQSNVFNQVEEESYFGDSGMAYSWKNRMIAPGKKKTFKLMLGIGDAQSGENVPIGINFDTQGGSEVESVIVEEAGDTVTEPEAPTYDGYTFGGWYLEPECTTAFDFATPINETITLYAKWNKKAAVSGGSDTCAVNFDSNGGTELPSLWQTIGTSVALDAYQPTKEGYVFAGWYSDSELTTPIQKVVLKQSITVYAKWRGVGEVAPELPFKDVAVSDWYYDGVVYAFNSGLMQGTAKDLFSPRMSTTRGMIVTILYRMEKEPATTNASSFNDVAADSYYAKAIAWAAEQNIVSGYGNQLFGPEDTITREQLAAILYRYAAYKNYDTDTTTDLTGFSDYNQISTWAQQAMGWANANKLIEGKSDTVLDPRGFAERSQVAAILQRFNKNIH